MKQKTIWIQLLIIGLISSLLFLSSCKKEQLPELIRADFIYKNLTSSKIIIDSYSRNKNYTYELDVNKSIEITQNQYPNFSDKLFIFCDSVRIANISGDVIIYYPETVLDKNPIKLENYKYLKVSGVHHKYSFEFVDTDFDNLNSSNK